MENWISLLPSSAMPGQNDAAGNMPWCCVPVSATCCEQLKQHGVEA